MSYRGWLSQCTRRLVVDSDGEELRGAAATVAGPRAAVDSFTEGREVIARSALGSHASVTLPRLDAPRALAGHSARTRA